MQLTVRKDRSEQFLYNCAKFPAYIGCGHTAWFPNYAALSHWHHDIEFGVVLSGGMDYNVNGDILRLEEGEGIFVNTRQLHHNFSRGRQDCEYICILLHPMLLCASQYVEDAFVTPVLENPSYAYRALRRDCQWAQRVCQKLREMYERSQEPGSQLAVQAGFFQIWEELYNNAPIARQAPKPRSRNLNALKDMVAFIQENYREKVSLEDIARAGNVSKTSCCQIFQKYVNQSPNAYLIEYRLRNGVELLRTTDMTVTEICYEVGFNGPSYFSESFRKAFGCSPLEYRGGNPRRHKENV